MANPDFLIVLSSTYDVHLKRPYVQRIPYDMGHPSFDQRDGPICLSCLDSSFTFGPFPVRDLCDIRIGEVLVQDRGCFGGHISGQVGCPVLLLGHNQADFSLVQFLVTYFVSRFSLRWPSWVGHDNS